MLSTIYEDKHIIVVKKPIGMESQSGRGFAADMVSEIKCHIHKTSTKASATCGQPYVGVIHRLDKPVSGLMVYAKTKQAAAILSKDVRDGGLNKQYLAILCGKPVDNVGKYVDYLLKSGGENYSEIINKDNTMWITKAKRAELDYRVIHSTIGGQSSDIGRNRSDHRKTSPNPRSVRRPRSAAVGRQPLQS